MGKVRPTARKSRYCGTLRRRRLLGSIKWKPRCRPHVRLDLWNTKP